MDKQPYGELSGWTQAILNTKIQQLARIVGDRQIVVPAAKRDDFVGQCHSAAQSKREKLATEEHG